MSHQEALEDSARATARTVRKGTRSGAVVCLCMMLSMVARRALLLSHAAMWDSFFLNSLHAMLAGRIRQTSAQDQWAFDRPEIVIQDIVWNAVRLSLKLHVNHFLSANGEEEMSHESLYDSVKEHDSSGLIIYAEGHPLWREKVMSDVPELLTLRQHSDETDGQRVQHSVLQLELRNIEFRVVEINAEAVRGLWSGQQHELVLLGNQVNSSYLSHGPVSFNCVWSIFSRCATILSLRFLSERVFVATGYECFSVNS